MKIRIALFISCFAILASHAFAEERMLLSRSNPYVLGAGAAAPAGACAGSDTYIGFTDTSTITNYQTDANYTKRGANVYQTIPAGKSRVCSFGGYVKSAGGTPGVIALAIYERGVAADYYPGALLCYGTAKTVSSTSVSWVENTYTEITPVGGSQGDACTIAEGTEVVVVLNKSTTDVSVAYLTQTSGDQKYDTGDTYWDTYNWPNPGSSNLANTASANCWRIRAGVQ